MHGIWTSPTEFVDFSAHNDLTAEIAVRSGSLVGQWLGLLPDPDPVLRKSGDGFDTLETLAADSKVLTSMQTRKLKTLGRGSYKFSPGCLPGEKPSLEAVRLCDALNRDLERIDLYNLISEALDAPFYGLTVAELLWNQGAECLKLGNIVPKPREWFGFDTDNAFRFVGDGFVGDTMGGILPPYGKFILARHFPTYKNPYGLRLLSRCLFPVAFKRGGIEFMMRFAEKWGMPWIVGKARPTATAQEMRDMTGSLAGMVSDAVAVVRGGSEVQIVESKGQAGDMHLSIVRYWDDAIAQVLMGQTLTSDIGDRGSYGASKTHAEILSEYADADATLVKIFFDELAWVYTQINARGVLSPVFSFDDPDDLNSRADLGKKLHDQGVRFTPVYYERHYGLAEDEFTVSHTTQPPAPPVQPVPTAPAAFAAAPAARFTPGQQAIEDLVDELLPQGADAMAGLTETILNLVAKAETPEELEALLAKALTPADKGGLDMRDFSQVMETALFAADMTGRFTGRENVT